MNFLSLFKFELRNRVKRFIFCGFCKTYGENFEVTIDADETTVELRFCKNTDYRKSKASLLRAAGKAKAQF